MATLEEILWFDATAQAELIRKREIRIGKRNVPEFGLLPTTEPVLFGPGRNPWNLDRIGGGRVCRERMLQNGRPDDVVYQ
jgi:Asp-tRNA(Asn)/Glu-tRNA(Gln) amidotransferase A subunit family amidase